jgi:hypothetical protein
VAGRRRAVQGRGRAGRRPGRPGGRRRPRGRGEAAWGGAATRAAVGTTACSEAGQTRGRARAARTGRAAAGRGRSGPKARRDGTGTPWARARRGERAWRPWRVRPAEEKASRGAHKGALGRGGRRRRESGEVERSAGRRPARCGVGRGAPGRATGGGGGGFRAAAAASGPLDLDPVRARGERGWGGGLCVCGLGHRGWAGVISQVNGPVQVGPVGGLAGALGPVGPAWGRGGFVSFLFSVFVLTANCVIN